MELLSYFSGSSMFSSIVDLALSPFCFFPRLTGKPTKDLPLLINADS